MFWGFVLFCCCVFAWHMFWKEILCVRDNDEIHVDLGRMYYHYISIHRLCTLLYVFVDICIEVNKMKFLIRRYLSQIIELYLYLGFLFSFTVGDFFSKVQTRERKKKNVWIIFSLYLRIRSLLSMRESSVIMSGAFIFIPQLSVYCYMTTCQEGLFFSLFWFNNFLSVCCSHFQVSKTFMWILSAHFFHYFPTFFFWMAEVSRHITWSVLRELICKKNKAKEMESKVCIYNTCV